MKNCTCGGVSWYFFFPRIRIICMYTNAYCITPIAEVLYTFGTLIHTAALVSVASDVHACRLPTAWNILYAKVNALATLMNGDLHDNKYVVG